MVFPMPACEAMRRRGVHWRGSYCAVVVGRIHAGWPSSCGLENGTDRLHGAAGGEAAPTVCTVPRDEKRHFLLGA